MSGVPVEARIVVILARRLLCRYYPDDCSKHDGHGGKRPEDGFQTCDACMTRYAAEAVRLDGERPRG